MLKYTEHQNVYSLAIYAGGAVDFFDILPNKNAAAINSGTPTPTPTPTPNLHFLFKSRFKTASSLPSSSSSMKNVPCSSTIGDGKYSPFSSPLRSNLNIVNPEVTAYAVSAPE